MIVEAAFEVARESGAGNINARTISQKLGCATQPVMWHFKTIADIKKAAYEKADRFHTEYIPNVRSDDPMGDIGMNDIRFAAAEKNLFHFIFQSDEFSGKSLSELIDGAEFMPLGKASDWMNKLYKKSELMFVIAWIAIYCVLQSLVNPLNEKIGIPYSASAVLCILQAVSLWALIQRNGLLKRYGLCKSSVPARLFLYYVPLLVLATGNLWNGVAVNDSLLGIVCRVVCMLCVGFIEEIIFRGFLFKAMEKDNVKSAIIVSSVTFGIGHLINLFNGSGYDKSELTFFKTAQDFISKIHHNCMENNQKVWYTHI